MISGDSEGVGRGEPEDIRLIGVGKDVERLGEGGIEQGFVADAVGSPCSANCALCMASTAFFDTQSGSFITQPVFAGHRDAFS